MTITNKIFSFFLVAIYLVIYFLSPFFHLHEEVDYIHNTSNYHSHFFDNNNISIYPISDNVDIGENDNHTSIDCLYFTITKNHAKFSLTIHKITFHSTDIAKGSILSSRLSSSSNIFTYGKIIVLERYVHSSGNTSPPFSAHS